MEEERVRFLLDEVWDPGDAPELLRAWVTENLREAMAEYASKLRCVPGYDFRADDVCLELWSSAVLTEESGDPWTVRLQLGSVLDRAGGWDAEEARSAAAVLERHAAWLRALADEMP